MNEQRKFVRKMLTAHGDIADGLGEHWNPIRLYDVSLGGVGLLCTLELQPGFVRMLRFALPVDPPNQVRAVFKVMHCVKHSLFDGYRIGGEFKELDAESREIIQRYIES